MKIQNNPIPHNFSILCRGYISMLSLTLKQRDLYAETFCIPFISSRQATVHFPEARQFAY